MASLRQGIKILPTTGQEQGKGLEEPAQILAKYYVEDPLAFGPLIRNISSIDALLLVID